MTAPKRVLCFGASNTWGSNPANRSRHPFAARWPGAMALASKGRIEVIEEGLRGRMTNLEDPTIPGQCGLTYLRPCLRSHHPLDLLIIDLGTNDTKPRYGATVETITAGMEALIDCARGVPTTSPDDRRLEILVLGPTRVGQIKPPYAEEYGPESPALVRALAPAYQALAARKGCHFFDAGAIVTATETDGLHLEAAQHKTLGAALAAFLADEIFPAGAGSLSPPSETAVSI